MDLPWTQPDLARQCPAAMLYQENSVLNPARAAGFQERILAFTEAQLAEDGARAAAKTYPHGRRVALPGGPWRTRAVERVIERRRTRRAFTGKGISARRLGRILRCAGGITGRASGPVGEVGPVGDVALRACPSAGALYPLEVYPVVLRSPDLPSGVHHYHVAAHALECLSAGDVRRRLEADLLGVELMPGADAALLITSVLERTLAKYGERGYRFVLIEVGHLAQNVALVCEAMGLNSVCLGGFHEDGLAELLDVDRRREPVQYVILLGTR